MEKTKVTAERFLLELNKQLHDLAPSLPSFHLSSGAAGYDWPETGSLSADSTYQLVAEQVSSAFEFDPALK